MEIKSDPQKYDTIQVIDLDIAFPGDLQTYTIKPEDSLEREGDTWTLAFAQGGKVVFNTQHAHWYAKRYRILRIPAKDAPPE